MSFIIIIIIYLAEFISPLQPVEWHKMDWRGLACDIFYLAVNMFQWKYYFATHPCFIENNNHHILVGRNDYVKDQMWLNPAQDDS